MSIDAQWNVDGPTEGIKLQDKQFVSVNLYTSELQIKAEVHQEMSLNSRYVSMSWSI